LIIKFRPIYWFVVVREIAEFATGVTPSSNHVEFAIVLTLLSTFGNPPALLPANWAVPGTKTPCLWGGKFAAAIVNDVASAPARAASVTFGPVPACPTPRIVRPDVLGKLNVVGTVIFITPATALVPEEKTTGTPAEVAEAVISKG
jgi:hypothetical protein